MTILYSTLTFHDNQNIFTGLTFIFDADLGLYFDHKFAFVLKFW